MAIRRLLTSMETNANTNAQPDVTGGDDHGTKRTLFRVVAAGLAVVLIGAFTLLGATPARPHGF